MTTIIIIYSYRIMFFVIFVLVLAYFRKKGTEAQKQVEASFWEREQKANHVRRQDISGLPYITIPLDNFTMGICDSPEIKEYCNVRTQRHEAS